MAELPAVLYEPRSRYIHRLSRAQQGRGMSPHHATENAIATDAERLHRLRTGRGWSDRQAMVEALQSAYTRAGWRSELAQYDLSGNCTTCGEAGRCPGVHITVRALPSRRSQVQQALAFDLPLFA